MREFLEAWKIFKLHKEEAGGVENMVFRRIFGPRRDEVMG